MSRPAEFADLLARGEEIYTDAAGVTTRVRFTSAERPRRDPRGVDGQLPAAAAVTRQPGWSMGPTDGVVYRQADPNAPVPAHVLERRAAILERHLAEERAIRAAQQREPLAEAEKALADVRAQIAAQA